MTLSSVQTVKCDHCLFMMRARNLNERARSHIQTDFNINKLKKINLKKKEKNEHSLLLFTCKNIARDRIRHQMLMPTKRPRRKIHKSCRRM